MKHLSQQMLLKELRRPHERRMRSRLLEHLRRPSLPPEEAALLRRRIANTGFPKTYEPEPVLADAVDPGLMPIGPIELDLTQLSYTSLSNLSHSLLFSYAIQRGLDVKPSATKAQIVSAVWTLAQGGRS